MEEMQEAKEVRRIFTPEQKFEVLKDIERAKTIKEDRPSTSWRNRCITSGNGRLAVGVRASLRNSRPLKPVDLKRLEAENRKLKEVFSTRHW